LCQETMFRRVHASTHLVADVEPGGDHSNGCQHAKADEDDSASWVIWSIYEEVHKSALANLPRTRTSSATHHQP
jgi:hypothetical protein